MIGSQPRVWVSIACDKPSSTINLNPNRCPICANRSATITDLPVPVIPNSTPCWGIFPSLAWRAVMLPELAQRHGSRRFEERLGEGYIRLVARLVQRITLHDRSLPLTFPLKPEKNREN